MFLARRRPYVGRYRTVAVAMGAARPIIVCSIARASSSSTGATDANILNAKTTTSVRGSSASRGLESELRTPPNSPAPDSNEEKKSRKTEKQQGSGLDLLKSAVEEVRRAVRDLGWGVDALAMRVTMLILHKKGKTTTGIPREATMVDDGEASPDRVAELERLLRWAYASYGWNEKVVAKRAGLQLEEMELIALSTGRARGRPMTPTYVLAVDHTHREIVLSVRGTKAIGDAITISHFRPEPFLDGYAHRGFAQSAHELVKEVKPQLAALRERLPEYRMGGGIAAMASMLLREPCSSQTGKETGSGPGPGTKSADASSELRTNSRSPVRQTGRPDGPEVVSFATPCCVSLDLARRCDSWVKSIVYADDAVPRLSAVSLELLKEDMTAAEWRRAVDRLARLSTSRPTLNSSLESVTAAFKAALDGGFGALSLAQSRWDANNVEGGQIGPSSSSPGVGSGTSEKSGEKGTGANSAGVTGTGSGDEEGIDARMALRKSVLDTVLTMRGLAEIEPLSVPFRNTIAGIITQVMRRTGEEKASKKCADNANGDVRDRNNSLGITNATASSRPRGTDIVNCKSDDNNKSRPRLLSLLQENIKILSEKRAALERSKNDNDYGNNSNGSSAAVEGMKVLERDSGDVVAVGADAGAGDAFIEREASSVPPGDGPTSAFEGREAVESGKRLDTIRNAKPLVEEVEKNDIERERNSLARGDDTTQKLASRSGLQEPLDLHELFLSREETTLLPLYPPGDPLLICNASRHKVAVVESSDVREQNGDGHPGGIVVRVELDRESVGVESVCAEVDGGFGADTVDDARETGKIIPNAERAATSARCDEGNTSRSPGSGDEEVNGRAAGEMGIAVDEVQGWAGPKKRRHLSADDDIVLVRVPHMHFLRMPVSPSMISDHTMRSYRHGLAGVKKRGEKSTR